MVKALQRQHSTDASQVAGIYHCSHVHSTTTEKHYYFYYYECNTYSYSTHIITTSTDNIMAIAAYLQRAGQWCL